MKLKVCKDLKMDLYKFQQIQTMEEDLAEKAGT